MRKITICNGKGGSGKTTATILLGLALVEAGHKAKVLDIDPQNTASRWITDGALPLDSEDASATVLIDTPPRLDNPDLRKSIRDSDIIIVVSSPSPADLFTSQDTARLIVSQIVLDLFAELNPQLPETSEARKKELKLLRKKLAD